MNFASWVILGIVLVIVGFAIRATFFKKKRTGGCCDTGDEQIKLEFDCSSLGCAGCSCSSCPSAKH